jgi:hypothetical protein
LGLRPDRFVPRGALHAIDIGDTRRDHCPWRLTCFGHRNLLITRERADSEFAGGAQGTICVSGVTHVAERGQDFQVRLYGDAGSLEIDFDFARSRLRGVQKGEEEWRDLPVPFEFLGQGENPPLWVFDFFAPFHQPVSRRSPVH